MNKFIKQDCIENFIKILLHHHFSIIKALFDLLISFNLLQ